MKICQNTINIFDIVNTYILACQIAGYYFNMFKMAFDQ